MTEEDAIKKLQQDAKESQPKIGRPPTFKFSFKPLRFTQADSSEAKYANAFLWDGNSYFENWKNPGK